ncbi:STAS domain-containing protein [Saccharomonospora glauca]|jgi:stage II sporulation protein AA (anti-sigma F factor antagonist)|uniref:Anti-sigma factor antagonist n=1 Tax=Saccharomonospora glauca K62 TaxID=928724 RepID=I1D657_9PSEU|nr:STAS domain-containing protein [Saccharomonospora glauca]EIF00432.1 anti-anti-sigma factor [Saccharomonospora glauca K62]
MTDGDKSPTMRISDGPEGSTVHVELVSNDEGRITLCGEIDHDVAPQLDDALDQLLAEGADRLVVDFKRLSFFDSACISALVRAHARISERGGTVKLVNVDRYAYRVLQIAGLLPLFEIEPET